MSRLPNPGGDDGQWGIILNDFLAQVHDAASGALKPNTVGTVQLQDDAVTAAKVSSTGASSGQVLTYNGTDVAWATVSSTAVTNATGGAPGLIQLSGDISGTATAPTVAKVNGVAISNAPSSGQVLTATSGTAASWSAPASAPDADGTTKGLVRLSGDLGGSATAPTVAKVNGVAISNAPSSGQVLTATSGTAASWSAPASAPVTSVAGRTGVITLAQSDITNLTTDLAGKVGTSDSRLTDTRTPTDNTVSTAKLQNNAVTYAKLSATGATNGQFLSYDGTNLAWATVSGGSSLTVRDEGSNITTAATSLNFTGAGVTASNSGGAVTVTIPGGGGGGNGSRTVTSVKTSAYTPAAGEYVIVNPTAGGFTVTLPTAQASGTWVSLKNIGTNSNAVLIAPGGSDSIEDSGNYSGLSVSLNSGQTCMDFIYDGTSRWYRVG